MYKINCFEFKYEGHSIFPDEYEGIRVKVIDNTMYLDGIGSLKLQEITPPPQVKNASKAFQDIYGYNILVLYSDGEIFVYSMNIKEDMTFTAEDGKNPAYIKVFAQKDASIFVEYGKVFYKMSSDQGQEVFVKLPKNAFLIVSINGNTSIIKWTGEGFVHD